MSNDPARRYLRYLQDACDWPEFARPQGPQDYTATDREGLCNPVAKRILRAAEDGFRRRRTQEVVATAWDQLVEQISDSDRIPPVAIGVLMTDVVNGCIWKVPDGPGYVITINRGLAELAFNAGLVMACRINNMHSEDELVSSSNELLDLELAISLLSYLRHDKQRPYPLFLGVPPLTLSMGATIASTALMLVLSHELGHCVLGHLDDQRAERREVGEVEAERYLQEREQECEADRVATMATVNWILRRSENKLLLSLGTVGLEMLFALFEVLEAAQSTGGVSSHPPARERWEASARVFHDEALMTPFLPEVGGWIASAAKHLDQSVEELFRRWNLVKSRLENHAVSEGND